MTFETNWLQWSFERSSRQFRMYVIEPKAYEPKTHGEVFDAVLRDFFDTASGQAVTGDVSAESPRFPWRPVGLSQATMAA
ncbi:hypothetical protein [Dechloromonas sp. A34]|uniref:hypothetical protein n=1 Tax=Dechloromonas sp. A34 TaxID=447588 RepID=UPI0022495AE0|nr:hypothetical protein [Dechloromonas sp. A34]